MGGMGGEASHQQGAKPLKHKKNVKLSFSKFFFPPIFFGQIFFFHSLEFSETHFNVHHFLVDISQIESEFTRMIFDFPNLKLDLLRMNRFSLF